MAIRLSFCRLVASSSLLLLKDNETCSSRDGSGVFRYRNLIYVRVFPTCADCFTNLQLNTPDNIPVSYVGTRNVKLLGSFPWIL